MNCRDFYFVIYVYSNRLWWQDSCLRTMYEYTNRVSRVFVTPDSEIRIGYVFRGVDLNLPIELSDQYPLDYSIRPGSCLPVNSIGRHVILMTYEWVCNVLY